MYIHKFDTLSILVQLSSPRGCAGSTAMPKYCYNAAIPLSHLPDGVIFIAPYRRFHNFKE
ncbi:MAG TPA: hypothetical protein VHC47_14230 [Mucilaginibacter sp.]|nr:hypothetical protein [Mucilaginibacter sp.]